VWSWDSSGLYSDGVDDGWIVVRLSAGARHSHFCTPNCPHRSSNVCSFVLKYLGLPTPGESEYFLSWPSHATDKNVWTYTSSRPCTYMTCTWLFSLLCTHMYVRMYVHMYVCVHVYNVHNLCMKTLFTYSFIYENITLREEYSLMVFENRALRNIFQPKKVEVRGSWKNLHEDMICILYQILPCWLHLRTVR
jgi:hypothetical protein